MQRVLFSGEKIPWTVRTSISKVSPKIRSSFTSHHLFHRVPISSLMIRKCNAELAKGKGFPTWESYSEHQTIYTNLSSHVILKISVNHSTRYNKDVLKAICNFINPHWISSLKASEWKRKRLNITLIISHGYLVSCSQYL